MENILFIPGEVSGCVFSKSDFAGQAVSATRFLTCDCKDVRKERFTFD